MAYVKPLRVPIPLAPKQCNVWEEHRCAMRQVHGCPSGRMIADTPKAEGAIVSTVCSICAVNHELYVLVFVNLLI